MNKEQLIAYIKSEPDRIDFFQVIEVIDSEFDFTPTRFVNGNLVNEANQNNGSCKIFSFARRMGLDEQQTLSCFGDFYRNDVLKHPENKDHQNIRNFILSGWKGIKFDAEALK
ncbi:HopJ type III effector protein [Vibrio salinus]|uniref:HopJ type III effector protein n=1 Tax=Vibrio salinus TaxID=2899784 RepID=UPI001E3A7A31|nr:HopJ type III effector protein [Vibrio salinus]MCE0494907.1 HopJ type III effector protein [Vibrio salinus]